MALPLQLDDSPSVPHIKILTQSLRNALHAPPLYQDPSR